MTVSQSIAALIAALVYPSALGSGIEQARRQMFVLRTLVAVFAALGVAPFFLAFHGAPTVAETMIFSFALMPLAAVMLVAKTGRLVQAHMICVACLTAAALTLAFSKEAGIGCAVALLVAAQTESFLSLERRLVIGTAISTGLAFCLIAANAVANHAPTASRGDLVAGLALAYAAINAVVAVDVRSRRRAADLSERRRIDAIVATVGDLVVSHDADGTVDFIGPDCERHLATPAQDLMGRGLFEHIHVADRPAYLKAIAEAAHGSETVIIAFRLRTVATGPRREGGFDTSFRWIEMRARRLDPDPSKISLSKAPGGIAPRAGVMALLRDVTAAKRTASDLEAARAAAEAASRSKNHFLANMSHELRTPLNAIIGFSEMLGDDALRPRDTDKQTEYARIIHQSGQHLLAVVNSILDMSKIQSGTFAIVPETFDVAPLIDSCCDILTLKAREGRIEIVRTDAPALDALIGDRRACKQILINLLSNAVKFTPENGRVTIGARPEGTSLLISVTDTGIGIAATDLARLGDPFFQAKSALDRPFEGTGLGLSVVRGLVGLHGGTIAVESEPGQGTSVTIRLPLDCRFVSSTNPSAKIETTARRRAQDRGVAQDRFAFPPHDIMVKKIA